MNDIRLIQRKPDSWEGFVNPYTIQAAEAARRFHRSFPEYTPTPLHSLKELAAMLGVGEIFVKDESPRFGLNAFKVLGGSYAIGRELQERFGLKELSFEALMDPALSRDITFVTATDGNHGRGVAWTASRLGFNSVVYLPKGTAIERLENIRRLGAQAQITPWNYDDTVRHARAQAEAHGWILVQDTAWPGYETIPGRIMQGYTTIGAEILEQLGESKPTHIFLQAGVGAMAAALAGYFTDAPGRNPLIIIVEPNAANCLFQSAGAGELRTVGGDLNTIMAGLACGEPCTLAWELLRRRAEFFASCPDSVAARGMRMLGNPLGGDPRIVSGESGASAFGFAMEVLMNPSLAEMKAKLGLNEASRLLFISTEGDTDRENYRRIVWNGTYSNA